MPMNFCQRGRADLDYYAKDRFEMVKFIPKQARKILDVGCGAGVFASRLKQELSAEVWGVDLCADAAGQAKKKIDRVIIGDISNVIDAIPEAYFECIIFNDVLEHLIDFFSVVNKIKSKLVNGGVLVASIPNIRYFNILKDLIIRKQWRYQKSGIMDISHLRFFTKKSIIEMFDSAGYVILNLEGLGPVKNSMEFRLLNFLSFGQLSDAKYPSFACTAKPK